MGERSWKGASFNSQVPALHTPAVEALCRIKPRPWYKAQNPADFAPLLIDVQRVMVSDDVNVVGGSADRLGSLMHPDAGKLRVGFSRNVFVAQGLAWVAVTVPSATGGLLLNDSVSVTV